MGKKRKNEATMDFAQTVEEHLMHVGQERKQNPEENKEGSTCTSVAQFLSTYRRLSEDEREQLRTLLLNQAYYTVSSPARSNWEHDNDDELIDSIANRNPVGSWLDYFFPSIYRIIAKPYRGLLKRIKGNRIMAK